MHPELSIPDLLPPPPQVNYEPVQCKGNCRSILNPYWCFTHILGPILIVCSGLDLPGKLWVCPFCLQRNPLPPQYADISETRLPAEVHPTYSTLEYVLPRHIGLPPIFLFTIDLCIETDWEKELQALKDSLLLSLNLLPENALVGLITFGQTVL